MMNSSGRPITSKASKRYVNLDMKKNGKKQRDGKIVREVKDLGSHQINPYSNREYLHLETKR